MALDFPTAPTVGQKYPASPLPGVPVYTWDGEKWTTIGGAVVGPGLPVLYDTAQTLTAPQQQQARQNIYAAPFDALAYNGLQINGAMDISQEKGTTTTTAMGGNYILDGYRLFGAGTMAVSAAQVVSGVNGFNNCLTVSVTTGQTTLGASDFVLIMHQIEGWRVARLRWGTAAAQPMTIAFWSIHHRTGLYSVQVQNGANNRSYVFTYTHNAADGFQYNVATIPGCTDGAWATDNAVSINICFTLAAGATYTASAANTWLTGNFMAAPGQVNGVAAATDVFRITGVTVLPGIEAPSAARSAFIMRPYDQELVTCKRYWERLAIYLSVYSTSGTGVAASGFFSVEKRVSPTLVFNNVASSNWTSSASYPDTRRVISVGSSPATGGCVIDVAYTCDARL